MKNSKKQTNINVNNNVLNFLKKTNNNKISNNFYLQKLNLKRFRNNSKLNLVVPD